jgi:hypothetical protein
VQTTAERNRDLLCNFRRSAVQIPFADETPSRALNGRPDYEHFQLATAPAKQRLLYARRKKSLPPFDADSEL